jgi:hypothetical protein
VFIINRNSCTPPPPQYLRHLLLEDIWGLVHYPCTHKSLRQRTEVQTLTNAWINIRFAWLCNPGRVPLPTPPLNHVSRISKLNPFSHCKVPASGDGSVSSLLREGLETALICNRLRRIGYLTVSVRYKVLLLLLLLLLFCTRGMFGPPYRSPCNDWLLAGRSGNRIPVGGGGEIFRTRPDRPWVPPCLYYNCYRLSFLVVKWPELALTNHPI